MRLRSLTLTSTAAPALALVLSAGILIGCGSSSDSAASTAPLTQAEYVQTAEAICKEAKLARTGLDPGLDSPEGRADLTAGITAGEKLATDLKALVPPSGLKAKHEEFVSVSADSASVMRTFLERAEADKGSAADSAALEADLKMAEALYYKQVLVAKELGLTECGANRASLVERRAAACGSGSGSNNYCGRSGLQFQDRIGRLHWLHGH